MHVGVLATIAGDRLPVGRELFRDRAVALFPEFLFDHLGDVGQHGVCQRMADTFGRGCGEQDEGVAVALLRVVGSAGVISLPEIAAVLLVAVAFPEIAHTVVDDIGRARAAEQVADGITMHHAGAGMDAAGGIVGRKRLAVARQVVEAALRVDRRTLEEIKEAICLGQQPFAMIRPRAPGAGWRLLRLIFRHFFLPDCIVAASIADRPLGCHRLTATTHNSIAC